MGILSCLERFGEIPHVLSPNNMWEDREAQEMLYQNGLSEGKKKKV